MMIGLHDADADRFKADLAHKFPNLALMKLSAFIDSHHREIRKAFESFRYASERTSLNNIEARAQAYARAFLSKYGV